MDMLPTYLRKRARRSFRYLQTQIADVTPRQALRYAEANWPDQRWGIGQNGSIAGIAYHVAAWKDLTRPLFQSGGQAGNRALFSPHDAPAPEDWPGIAAWLERAGAAWLNDLERLPDGEFDSARGWEGATISLAEYVSEMLEHDIQHAAQIEYLRQRLAAEDVV